MCFSALAPRVLLVFNADTTLKGSHLPPHVARGSGHFALGVLADSVDAWRDHLTASSVEIEKEVTWPLDGKSLYFATRRVTRFNWCGNARRVVRQRVITQNETNVMGDEMGKKRAMTWLPGIDVTASQTDLIARLEERWSRPGYTPFEAMCLSRRVGKEFFHTPFFAGEKLLVYYVRHDCPGLKWRHITVSEELVVFLGDLIRQRLDLHGRRTAAIEARCRTRSATAG